MSDLYLYHHGILGQKWGVRRYQNPDGTLTPAGRAKRLNDLDQQLRAVTIGGANAAYAKRHYLSKADKARVRGNYKKEQKFRTKADDNDKRMHAYAKKYVDIGMDYVSELDSLKKSGLSYKVKNLNFVDYSMKNGKAATKDIVQKYGRNWIGYSNAASGNKFYVKDPSKLSERKRNMWDTQKSVNTIRPQRVIYTYY